MISPKHPPRTWISVGLILILGFQLVEGTYAYNSLPMKQPKPAAQLNRVGIYVNASIFANISAELAQYVMDVQTACFNVSLYNWSDVNPMQTFRAANLRANLTAEYALGLIGAVFIGEMPYATYEANSLHYPCELFFMDLDGLWQNADGDEDYELHQNGTGNMYPEIFIGRLNPFCLMAVTNATDLLVNYFHRNHQYRTSMQQIQNNSLMWIDDDWEPWSAEWKVDLNRIYSNVTLINNSVTTTDKTSYVKEITTKYDFAHVFIHSDWLRHYIKVGGIFPPGDNVQNFEIRDLDDKVLFYNLYCCYAAQFNATDNIASQYLFSSNYTLAIYGSSRTGGFLLNQYLYEPLKASRTLGQAFQDWWSNDIYEPSLNHGPNDLNMTGNALLGDPTLRLYRPPPQSSLPHLNAPVLEVITPNPSLTGNITLNWTDIIEATGYEIYRVTANINSIAGLTPITTATVSQYIDTGLTNGTYYYVVVAKNTLISSSLSNCEAVTVTILPAGNSNTEIPFNLIDFLMQNIIPISIVGLIIIGVIVIKVKRKPKAKV